MSKEKILAMQKQVTGKLMAAISMLLVSAILMCLTSYAWFILSTAPEVSNLKTTAGANGALEIALANTVTEGDLKKPGEPYGATVGASSAVFMQSVEEANRYWGNIVDLTNNYGLGNLTLYPSRINLSSSIQNSVLMSSPLLAPKFGEDGRIVSLSEIQKAMYNAVEKNYYFNTDYGVHLLGFFDNNESAETENATVYSRQDVVSSMSNNVEAARENMRREIADLINSNSKGIFGILMETGMVSIGSLSGYTDTYKPDLAAIINGLDKIADEALDSLRYAVMATATADETNYPNSSADKLSELADMYAGLSEMSTDKMGQIARDNGYGEIVGAIESINSVKSSINSTREELEKHGVANALLSIFDLGTMQLNEQTGLGVIQALFGMQGDPDHLGKMYIWSSESIDNTTLFPAMAKIIGDYSAYIEQDVSVYGESMEGIYHIDMYMTEATSPEGYSEETNVGVLANVRENTRDLTVEGEFTIVNRVTTSKSAFGYSVDFAVKASKAGKLQLQQTAVDRVTGLEGDGSGSDTMGSGSTMQFKPAGDMTNTDRLMDGVHIVFMRTTDGYIYGVATADMENKTVDEDGTVHAPLKLHRAEIENGVVRAGTEVDSLLNMDADATYYITAVVYLNGDTVTNDMVSATEGVSLNGGINLQFSSDADLTPMNYSDYVTDNTKLAALVENERKQLAPVWGSAMSGKSQQKRALIY